MRTVQLRALLSAPESAARRAPTNAHTQTSALRAWIVRFRHIEQRHPFPNLEKLDCDALEEAHTSLAIETSVPKPRLHNAGTLAWVSRSSLVIKKSVSEPTRSTANFCQRHYKLCAIVNASRKEGVVSRRTTNHLRNLRRAPASSTSTASDHSRPSNCRQHGLLCFSQREEDEILEIPSAT